MQSGNNLQKVWRAPHAAERLHCKTRVLLALQERKCSISSPEAFYFSPCATILVPRVRTSFSIDSCVCARACRFLSAKRVRVVSLRTFFFCNLKTFLLPSLFLVLNLFIKKSSFLTFWSTDLLCFPVQRRFLSLLAVSWPATLGLWWTCSVSEFLGQHPGLQWIVHQGWEKKRNK